MSVVVRHLIDVAIVTICLALFLLAGLWNRGGAGIGGIALASPPPLARLRTMTHVPGNTRFSLDTVRQDGSGAIVVANGPSVVTIERDRPTTLVGWAVDAPGQRAADAVYVLLDGRVETSCPIGIERTDVAAAYNVYAYGASGFSCTIPADSVGAGRHAIQLDVVLRGGGSFYAVTTPIELQVR